MTGFDEQLQDWWDEYQLTHDLDLRDRLVLALAPMIRHIVEYRARYVPASRSLDELTRVGFEEMIALLEDYEHCELTLQDYAWTRVNHAVIEHLRRPTRVRRAYEVGPDLLYAGAY